MLSFIMHLTITNPMQAHYVFLIMYLFIYAICFPNEVLKLYSGSNIVFFISWILLEPNFGLDTQ